MNYTIDETVIDAIDSDDEVRAGNESSKSVALLRMPSSNGEIGNHEQLRNWESPTQKKTSLGKVTAQIKPMSPDKINSSQTHSTSYTASSDEEVVIVEDDDCILDHAATSRSNAADRSRKLATFGKRTETGGRMREKNNLSIVIKVITYFCKPFLSHSFSFCWTSSLYHSFLEKSLSRPFSPVVHIFKKYTFLSVFDEWFVHLYTYLAP